MTNRQMETELKAAKERVRFLDDLLRELRELMAKLTANAEEMQRDLDRMAGRK